MLILTVSNKRFMDRYGERYQDIRSDTHNTHRLFSRLVKASLNHSDTVIERNIGDFPFIR